MPGVIMEDRLGNGSHTNHDRNPRHNGINGTNYASEKGQDKGKARAEPQQNMTPVSPVIFNGVNGSFPSDAARNQNGGNGGTEMHDRANELPPEILHITYGYLPLSQLLTRLAQQSHSKLSKQIVELAHMPLPTLAVNGNSGHSPDSSDNSVENVTKKMNLLNFTQDLHADWTKALVITEWSRKAADVSKIIDLKIFLQSQHSHYLAALDGMGMLKRDLAQAKIPNPDLKTALEVLSTGKASWMPELGYIEPSPLTAREILKQLEDLNTLLSIRLNLHEYERVPFQFKNYSIKSGRVTFIVPGEFEVDLTIADEDPESQFWFIDFRFLFSPSLSDLTENLRSHIENKVNAVLLKDGLPGCYKYLHELVLTHKISEFRRQAVELSRGRWIEGVKVEPLNRALCIQYWLDRYGKDGPKSWVLLGVHSGRRKDGLPDSKATSRLFLRWFRDSKEVKDIEIPFDDIEISVETLLKRVVAMHIKHILTATYDKLNKRELFANHEAALSLTTSSTEPMESGLKVQLTGKQLVTIAIEQVTGRFTFSPASRLGWDCERRLNGSSPDPATDAEVYVAQLRCTTLGFEIASRASSVGWLALSGAPPGLKRHDLSDVMPKKVVDGFKDSRWFKRPGWSQDWLVVVTLSMDGDHWWLMKTAPIPAGIKVTKAVEIPIKGNWASEPTFSFLSTLHIFAAALICLYTNLDALHTRRIRHRLQDSRKPLSIHVPGILVDLPSLLPSSKESRSKMFSQDVVKLTFQGLEMRRADSLGVESETPSITPAPAQEATPTQTPLMAGSQKAPGSVELAVMVTEARMVIPGKLTMLQERVDQDMAFQAATGVFAFRLRSQVGEIIIPSLIQRLSQVERLVDFVEVVSRHRNTLHCESISLGKIVFTYSSESMPAPPAGAIAMDVDRAPKRYRATVEFSAAENSMKLTLERNNPHIRLMDHLSKILNSPEGLGGVATCLPLTLPALRGLDNMEEAWQDLFEKGDVVVHIRSAQWYTIRYTFSTVSPKQSSRKILFDLKLLQRRGESWWNVRRVDQREKDGDDIDEKLKNVWNGSGHGWFGARMSAIARPAGIEDCLGKIDEVIRTITSNDKPAEAKPQPVPTNTNLRAPVAPMAPMAPMAQMQPQAQMMPTAPMMQRHLSNQQHKAQPQRPNAAQNQGRNMPSQPQGRPASMMNQARKPAQPKEFIEID